MIELSELTSVGDTETLPGFTISPFDLQSYAIVENHLKSQHLARMAEATASLPEQDATAMRRSAEATVASGAFAFGGPLFEKRVVEYTMLPFLLWVSLRITDAKISKQQAAALITRQNYAPIREAVLDAMGCGAKKNNWLQPTKPATDQPTG